MRLQDLMRPKKRLQTLFMFHALGSFFVGIIGFVFVDVGSVFTDGGVSDGVHEHQGAASVAHVMIRLYCALVVAQGWIILHLTDATALVKKPSSKATWLLCGLAMSSSLHICPTMAPCPAASSVCEPWLLALTCGYGWLALFQLLEVFNVLGNSL